MAQFGAPVSRPARWWNGLSTPVRDRRSKLRHYSDFRWFRRLEACPAEIQQVRNLACSFSNALARWLMRFFTSLPSSAKD